MRPWERQARAEEMGVGPDLAERLGRHRAWDLFEHLAAGLRDDDPVNAAQLASLLLDRSTPRPPSRAVAGQWWDGTMARIASSEILAEGLWTSEEEAPPRLDEAEARPRFEAALVGTVDDGPGDSALREHWLMGRVMPELRGRVPGHTVRTWVKEVLA
jgi:hypothetical protein